MAIKKDLVPSILNKVRTTYQNSINDNSGLFRQGKFTPIKAIQDIGQSIGQTKLPSGITLKQLPSAYMQSFSQSRTLPEKLMNIGTSSFLKAASFGLLQPQAPKAETGLEKFYSGLGGLTGFVGPGSAGMKAMTGIDKLGQAGIMKFAPKLQTTLAGKIAGGLGKEAAQTGAYMTGKYLAGKAGLKPEEKITGKSILTDLAIGAAMRGITTPGAIGMVRKAISPDVWTSDRNILNEALQRLKVGETIDEFSETGKAIKNMYKEYGLASYPNWNKLSQSQQVNVLSERLDEMARSGFNIKMGIYGGKEAQGYKPDMKGQFSNMADKKVRFEIDDSSFKFKPVTGGYGNKTFKLGDLVEHKKLFENYPELKNMEVSFGGKGNASIIEQGNKGSFDKNKITINNVNSADEAKSTLLHEIQHAIQTKEGFAKGGNIEQFRFGNGIENIHAKNERRLKEIRPEALKIGDKIEDLSFSGKQADANKLAESPLWQEYQKLEQQNNQIRQFYNNPMKGYQRLSGEIEARDVSARIDLTPEQRARTQPYVSQGIPQNEWITKFDDNTSLSSPIKTGGDDLLNEAKKYSNADDFVDAKIFRDAHSAPRFDKTPVKQRMEEGGDYNLLEVVKGQHNQPSDYFDTRVGPRYYMYDDQQGMESLTAINNVKRGAKTVTAYRVVPKDIKVDKLIDGDWISFSKQYALDHGEHRFGEGAYKIIEQEVPAKYVWWDGNDIREWGYDTGKTKNLSRSELTDIWNKANLSPESGSNYLYHGTSEGNLENIIKEGLKPGISSKKISLSKSEDYSKRFAKTPDFYKVQNDGVLFRVNKNLLEGKIFTTKSKVPSDQLNEVIAKETIPSEYLEIYKNGQWQPLKNLSPESKGIKPALIDKKIDVIPKLESEKLVQPDLKLPEVPIEKTQIPTPETLQSAQTAPLDSQDIIPKERGFITTVKESEITTPEVKAGIEGTYEPITNKETIAKAKKAVSSGWDLAKERVMGKEYNADVVAVGEELARVAQKEGRTDEAIEILETLSRKATDAGQGIQALSIWKRLTPEGMLKFAEKELKKSEENAGFLTKLFKKGDTKISQEGKRFIMDEMAKVQKMADGPEKNKIIQSVLNRINDEIPIGASEIFDAYRYQNLLSSPRTQLRNAYQNAYQALINKPATLASEATVDWIGSTLKGTERTKYFSDVPTYYKGLWNSRIDANNAFMDVWKGKDDFTNLDIRQLRAKNLPKKLTVVSRLMEGADKYFQSLIGGGEYAKLMKNGATEEVAKKGAKEAAEYYLLRNLPDPKNKTGQGLVLTAIDNATVGVTELGRRIPALRWFVPFIRTPMNAAKQWIEYSPAGVLTTIGAKNKSSQLAKAMIGSVVTGIGASLALQDRTTWSAPTDAKEKEFFYASGKKPYSIKIGDKWVPMVYLGPQALALAIPAAFKQYQTDSKTALTDTQLEKATKSVTSLLGFFSEQTFLTGMGNFVRAISGDADYTFAGNIAGAAGQVLPLSSLQRYVAQIVDPVFRKTSGGKGLTGQFMNQMKSQIPFLTKTLEPYTLPNGELSKRNITDYVAPYSMGIQKDEYEPYLESRKAKLQQNAVINKAKKDLETTGGTQEIDGKILYTKDGEVKTLDLGKVSRLPEQTAYQRALKQKEAYKIVDDVLDNLEGDQQINALKALGITSADATYYNTARQENYLKTIYVEEEIRNMIGQGQTKDQILNTLASMRRAVNEKILLSDGVINDLVDKNIISYQDGKALKNLGKDLKPKKLTTGKAKKAKKITLTKPKVTPIKETFKEVKYPTTRAKTTAQLPKYVKPNFTTSFKLL